MIKATIDLLGYKATDRVTGLQGVISSVCFDLYGCVQAALTPAAKDGEIPSSQWFDVQRLIVSTNRAMTPPDFDAKARVPSEYDSGPAEKAPPRA